MSLIIYDDVGTPLRSWHVRTCPAVIAYRPEVDCECGGAERHHREHQEARRRALEVTQPPWWLWEGP